MGYSTDFNGAFIVTPTLKPEHKAYLAAFADSRRVTRDEKVTAERPDPLRAAVGLPVGIEGGYYVADDDGGIAWDQIKSAEVGIVNYNHAPQGQPGLWCQWVPNAEGDAIQWDGGEKFYYYVEWVQYLIDHFFKTWGYKLNGKIKWKGEERSDKGYIFIDNNKVYINEQPTVLDKIVQAVETKENDDGAQQNQRTGPQRGQGVVRKRRGSGGTGRKA